MDRKNKITILISMIGIIIILVSVSYAYFSANIQGAETASTVVVTGGTLSIVYENLSNTITVNNIFPRDEEWVSKNFTVTGSNTTDLQMKYKIGIEVMGSDFGDGDLTYRLINTNSDSGTPIATMTSQKPIPSSGTTWIGKGSFGTGQDQEHAYTLKIYFPNSSSNQNSLFNASFAAKVVIEAAGNGNPVTVTFPSDEVEDFDINYSTCMTFMVNDWGYTSEESEILCTGDELRYSIDSDVQHGWYQDFIDSGTIENVVYDGDDIVSYTINYNNCMNLYENQWEYSHTNSNTLCTGGSLPDGSLEEWIQDDPDYYVSTLTNSGIIGNLRYAQTTIPTVGQTYVNGQFTYTYKQYGGVISFYAGDMTVYSEIEEDGWTVKVTDPDSTVPISTELITSINGKPVISTAYMFAGSMATSIDLSDFDTSNVKYMQAMFEVTENLTTLDLSPLDTSNVVDMGGMFESSHATSLNLSGFNTSNVTNMSNMFYGASANYLDLTSFNTSRVTNMGGMFQYFNGNIIDLSSFNTSSVTNMGRMFSSASNLTTVYVSNSFVTSQVTNSYNMFKDATSIVGGNNTHYNSSYVDKTYARIDIAGTPGYFTDVADKP